MRLCLVDSIAELQPADAGCIAISGSHGGISAGRYALAVRPTLTVFNDAGVGLREAGIAALALLQTEGLAACTVSHTSACIGQAASTLETGVISHANAAARALGLHPGNPLIRWTEAHQVSGAPSQPDVTAARQPPDH